METIWTNERRALAEACCKKWQGTPHRNRIAVHGVGIDCIQFVNEILTDAGIVTRQRFGGYDIDEGMFAESDKLAEAIKGTVFCEEVLTPQFGDIAVFRTGTASGHAGFCTDLHLWHSLARNRVMHGKIILWRHRFVKILRITQLGWKGNPQQFAKTV